MILKKLVKLFIAIILYFGGERLTQLVIGNLSRQSFLIGSITGVIVVIYVLSEEIKGEKGGKNEEGNNTNIPKNRNR
ncbi:MAG: hypothetical protein ACOCRX_06325 [Candidatus Woesearchaeota archaeon]